MNMYCKVYLDADMPKEAVLSRLAQWVEGQVQLRTITADAFEVDVVANDGFDVGRKQGAEDGFLFYRYYLDIEPRSGVPEDKYIGAIRHLLTEVRAEGIKAVASCDFEYLLLSPL